MKSAPRISESQVLSYLVGHLSVGAANVLRRETLIASIHSSRETVGAEALLSLPLRTMS